MSLADTSPKNWTRYGFIKTIAQELLSNQFDGAFDARRSHSMMKELKQGRNFMEPTPIQISNVRLRLRAIRAFSRELTELLDEIDEMGEYSQQLVPDLMEAMKGAVYFPAIPLVSIIARLKSSELLDATLAQDDGTWALNTFDRCTLLTAGFLQFEKQLLEELFQIFENDAEPRRSAIVEAYQN